MGKSVTVVHWLLLTLGLAAAQAGKVLNVVFGGKSRNLENTITEHFIVRPSAQLQ